MTDAREPAEDEPFRVSFDEVKARYEAGEKPSAIKSWLLARGVDAEAAQVLVNSLPSAPMPSALPEPSVSLTTNPLAPDLFSLTELGLQGSPGTVGAYWIAFALGLLFVLLLVMFIPMPELFGSGGPSDAFLYFVEEVLPPAGLFIVVVALVRGFFLVLKGRRLLVRRRSQR
jgi:hypothetical protein